MQQKNDAQLKMITLKLLNDPSKKMRIAAYKNLHSQDKKDFAKRMKSKAANGNDLQVIYTVISDLGNCGVDDILIKAMQREMIRGRHPRESQLELITACEKSKNKKVQQLLGQYKSNLPKDDKYAEFSTTLFGGDPKNGRKLVYEQGVGQCIICHKVEGKGGIVAPDLSNIASLKRTTGKYLLESILAPSDYVVPGFGNISVVLKNEETIVGSLAKEDKEALTLKLADGSQKIVKVSDIKSKTPPISSMPPMGAILKKHEIRDIIAYLQTLKGSGAH